ncbi:MAG: NAD(P)-dependent glycerol-3-phosphate dehydrogenase, partial [Elusimicrobia bacterium]|nr:NAD(P)-dependent glycerol-3-phosphate dehydrogenase [Elusimicrobiota bacterium]
MGGGLWGSVLADHLARRGSSVTLWEFFPEVARALETSRKHAHIPKWELHERVRVTSDIGTAVRGAGLVVVVLPSAHVRKTLRGLAGIWRAAGKTPLVVTASKGVEPDTLKTMSEVIEEEAPQLTGRVYALSGPSFAREVARGVATKVMIAGPNPATARELQALFSGGAMRVELTGDRRGVELGGTLKNVLAVGCGMLDGMKAGFNTKAALLTEGMNEMGRLIRARGGKAETVYGLAGLGDLILTGTSSESRNRTVGEKLGAGLSLAAARKEIPTVKEGVESAKSAYQMIRAENVEAPV